MYNTSIIKKFKKFFIWFFGSIFSRLNRLSIRVFRVFPINNKRIVMESEGDYSDNSQSLYQYLLENNYLEDYEVIWLVNEKRSFKSCKYPNTKFSSKKWSDLHLDTSYYLATCFLFIYDHSDILYDAKRKGQRTIFLGHGCTFKAPSGNSRPCLADEVYVTGKIYFNSVANWCNCSLEKMRDIGYPRLDYFFREKVQEQKSFLLDYKFDDYSKILLWMPTYRKSINKELSEDYFQSDTGLPILYSEKDLLRFDAYLKEKNYLCIFKIHHLQSESSTFNKNYTNILVLRDNDIRKRNLQLYQIIILTDLLITDYSSIANDYMLLNKPIVYTLDDYEEYKNSRGLCPPDAIRFFVGDHVYNYHDLIEAISKENDDYVDARKKIIYQMHSFIDGNASQRIVQHLGLQK